MQWFTYDSELLPERSFGIYFSRASVRLNLLDDAIVTKNASIIISHIKFLTMSSTIPPLAIVASMYSLSFQCPHASQIGRIITTRPTYLNSKDRAESDHGYQRTSFSKVSRISAISTSGKALTSLLTPHL